MAQIITEKHLFDKDFRAIPTDTKLDETKDLIIVEVIKYEKTLLAKKEISRDYVIAQGDKQVVLDKNMAHRLKKHKSTDAFFTKMIKANPGEKLIKPGRGRNYIYVWAAGILAVVLLGSAIGSYFWLTNEKNFSGNTIELTRVNADTIKIGDYVKVDVPILDYIDIEETTTRSTYGVKTGESKSRGNSYLLSFLPPLVGDQTAKTFIYRYAPDSETAQQVETIIDQDAPLLTSVEGEIRPLSQIEKLDGVQQIESYFNAQLRENLPTVETVTLFVDGRVSAGDLNFVLLVSGILGALAMVALAPTIIFWMRYQKYMEELFGA